MHRLLLSTVVFLGLCLWTVPSAQTPQAAPAQDDTTRLNAWFEARFEEQLAFSPIQQTFLGRKSNAIDDLSIAAQDTILAWQRATVADLKANFDYARLTPEAQTSYDLWMYQLQQAEAALPFRTNAYIFDQMTAIHAFVPQLLIAFHRVDDASDMAGYVNRIRESGRALRQLIEVSKQNAVEGVRPPRFAFDVVIDESTRIITGAPFDTSGTDSAVWADVQAKIADLQSKGALDATRAKSLLDEARAALTGPFRGAYEALIAWQKEDRANAPAQTSGVSALPNGAAYYNERLANQTTTTLTADHIHAIGLAEVTRLRAEMEAIRKDVGFAGDLQAFFTELRDSKDNPRYYYPDTDAGRQAYLDDSTAAINKIKAVLPTYFGILPKADLVVRRVEPFREQPGAAQHYFPGTPDGSRPGVYYAHLSDMNAMPKSELEVIAYHEGLPGHHMQLAIAQELTSVPTFRRQAQFTAYSEGWGLYSEWLAREMPGTYEDPYSEFGRLGSEIWRAIRLVVDTGLHAKGWSEEQAVQYFLANSATTEQQARSEIRRYMVLPGQATSYKIGMLKIQELRRKAEAALGPRFDIRAFHDTILGGGAMPLTLLEKRVDRWIASVPAPQGRGGQSGTTFPGGRMNDDGSLMPAGPSSTLFTQEAYTQYEILEPGSEAFAITYMLENARAGTTEIVNATRAGSMGTNISVFDPRTGQPVPFTYEQGANGQYAIRATLPFAVPEGGIGRVLIYKTYTDGRTYQVNGDAIVWVRSLSGYRLGVVLPKGYAFTSSNVAAHMSTLPDGRLKLAFANPSGQANNLTIHATKSTAAFTPSPYTDVFLDDIKTLYDLGAPESGRFHVEQIYSDPRKGATASLDILNYVALSDLKVVDLDTAKVLAPVKDGTATRVTLGIPITNDQQSAHLRVTGTGSDGYRLVNDELVFDREMRGLRNTVVLPAGWEVAGVSQAGTIGRTREGRVFVALVNLNAENRYRVMIRARKGLR